MRSYLQGVAARTINSGLIIMDSWRVTPCRVKFWHNASPRGPFYGKELDLVISSGNGERHGLALTFELQLRGVQDSPQCNSAVKKQQEHDRDVECTVLYNATENNALVSFPVAFDDGFSAGNRQWCAG